MTEKIQHIIDTIRLKCKTLHAQLESERSVKINQEAEITDLKSDVEDTELTPLDIGVEELDNLFSYSR